MFSTANVYDLCDSVILGEDPTGPPGENLRLIYQNLAGNFFLKHFLLAHCRHPQIPMGEVPAYADMMRAAMRATVEDWASAEWINTTFKPIAFLLDSIENPRWQERGPVKRATSNPSRGEIQRVLEATLDDAYRVWAGDRKDPYFPVAAQVVLTGDDHMDGENFLNVLRGLGNYEYKNMTVVMSLIRCFLMANPKKCNFFRKPYRGVCEVMRQRIAWIWHRSAYYDVFFFESLLNLVERTATGRSERERLLPILENLVRFITVTSIEWLVSPNHGTRFPAITCLPRGEGDLPLTRLSLKDWKKKELLGFGDYVPDTDTTFLGLAVARRWIDFAESEGIAAEPDLLCSCREFLDHPWVGIIEELQFGSRYESNPPTIQITRPLDYYGAVPIWFDKPFEKPGGRTLREALGNEICPGHNMDIFEAILANRKQWRALEGENLEVVHRFLEFHHRAYISGNFKVESALKYYLPEIYIFYTGRMYDRYLTLGDEERAILDPEGKIEEIRAVALNYVGNDLIGLTLNPFDAALAISTLVLMRYPSKDDGVVATAFGVLSDSLGEGRRRHPYKAYEWNRMRHPTRIIVGSDVATTLFVLNACIDAQEFFFEGE